MHHPFIYKRVHKVHHEWTAPISLAVVYVHPFEHIVSWKNDVSVISRILYSAGNFKHTALFYKNKNPRNLLATFISLEVHLAAYLLQPAKQSSGHGNVKVNSTKRNEIA